MKNILKIFIAAALCTGLVSCNDWFDVSPKTEIRGDIMLESESGFKDALVGVYALLTTPTCYGENLTFGYADVAAQLHDNIRNSANHTFYEAANYEYDEPSEEGRRNAIWSRMYKSIANLNAIIEAIDAKKDIFTGVNYQLIKGEALGLRGFIHFELLRLYGPMPSEGTSVKTLPYVDKYTNRPFPQLTFGEFIGRVTDDLSEAAALMRDADPFGPSYDKAGYDKLTNDDVRYNRASRFNYYAATAALARVYLYAGDKEKALENAKVLVGEPGSALDAAPLQLATAANENDPLFTSELIFALDVAKMQTQTERFFGTDALTKQPDNLLLINKSNLETLYAKANPADVDYRTQVMFKPTPSGDNTMRKYDSGRRMPLIRLSEVYLIAAETAASTADRMAYLNTLKNHRGLSDIDPSSSAEQIQDEIRREYMKEFYGEGQMFYFYKRTASTTIGILDLKVTPSEIYRMPFPDAEVEYGRIE